MESDSGVGQVNVKRGNPCTFNCTNVFVVTLLSVFEWHRPHCMEFVDFCIRVYGPVQMYREAILGGT